MEKISYGDVETMCNGLHAVAKTMKEILENIDGIKNQIASGSSWSGRAASSYSEKLGEVTKNFDEVFIEIENSILFMASCAEGYQAIDKLVLKEICSNLNITEPNLSTSNIFNGG